MTLISEALLFRAGLAHLLEAAGMAIAGQFTRCDEALPVVRSERPQIILLDVTSDREVFACVDALVSAAPHSRVIVLSEPGGDIDCAKLIELGAAGLVPKTAAPEVLVKAVTRVHAGELWLDRIQTAKACGLLVRRRRTMESEAGKIAALTKREHEILALIGQGLKNAVIGERLFISESTVRNHLTSILSKLDVADRFELVVYAFKHGLVRYYDLEIEATGPVARRTDH